ncbi:MAG: glycosyltransferase family 4 protein [Candidatus Bathyarchaeia archaeon]
MKIAIFAWNFPPTQDPQAFRLFEFSRFLVLRGNDVTIFAFNPGELPTREIWAGLEINRPLTLEVAEFSKLLASMDWLKESEEFMKVFSYDHAIASKFIEMVEKEGFSYDVATIYDWQNAGAGLIIKKTFPKMPLVFHINSIEENSAIAEHLKRKFADVSDMIVTVSQLMRNWLVALGYPSEKLHVVYEGCNHEIYDPSKIESEKVDALRRLYGIQSDENVILYMGKLERNKKIDKLIHALPLVCSEFPNTKLVIVGKGEIYSGLVSLASRLNITERVIIRNGWLYTEEKLSHYGLATICIFPSFLGSFENAMLEAMAMKIPIIASWHFNEIIEQGSNQCGLLINGGNPIDIAKGIKEVFANKERARKWGENGRRKVLERFTLENTLQAITHLYSKLQ